MKYDLTTIIFLPIDNMAYLDYPPGCPGGSGAADTCEPRQIREEAAVCRLIRVPPVSLPGYFIPLVSM